MSSGVPYFLMCTGKFFHIFCKNLVANRISWQCVYCFLKNKCKKEDATPWGQEFVESPNCNNKVN